MVFSCMTLALNVTIRLKSGALFEVKKLVRMISAVAIFQIAGFMSGLNDLSLNQDL